EKVFANFGVRGSIIKEPAQGKGHAVRRAFLEIDADVYVMVDADMTYSADDLAKLIAPVVDNKADMAVGDRHSLGLYKQENKRRFHNLGNGLVQRLVNFTCGTNFVDVMSGYRAFSRVFVQTYPLLVSGFQLETDMSMFAANFRLRVVEIPVHYQDRPAGSFSKLSTYLDGLKVVMTISSLFRYYKPLYFFGIISGFLALLGLLCGLPVIYEWLTTGYILHLPLAVLAVGIMIVSVIFLCIGLLLDSQAYARRMDIERIIKNCTRCIY
ncbi:MAG: glycosyltransferase, partial [Deltaproteobacteria bacterium]|nr:glycosyltransferase [Deltaproteobacteria bacterium]